MDQLTFGNFVIQIGWAHFVHVYPYFEILLFFQIIIETFNCWLHIPLIRNKCIILCHFPSFTSYFAFKNFTNLKFKFLLVFQQSPFELKPHYLSIIYSTLVSFLLCQNKSKKRSNRKKNTSYIKCRRPLYHFFIFSPTGGIFPRLISTIHSDAEI